MKDLSSFPSTGDTLTTRKNYDSTQWVMVAVGETVEKEYSYAWTARGKMFPQGGNIPGES